MYDIVPFQYTPCPVFLTFYHIVLLSLLTKVILCVQIVLVFTQCSPLFFLPSCLSLPSRKPQGIWSCSHMVVGVAQLQQLLKFSFDFNDLSASLLLLLSVCMLFMYVFRHACGGVREPLQGVSLLHWILGFEFRHAQLVLLPTGLSHWLHLVHCQWAP